jgi:hypothetical protein
MAAILIVDLLHAHRTLSTGRQYLVSLRQLGFEQAIK